MSSPNRSTAVMQRRKVAPDSLDYFPTPPFATRALCEFLKGEIFDLGNLVCWEPACGEGHMVRPLREYFAEVIASDAHCYRDDHEIFDFTLARFERRGDDRPDFIVTNPPFKLALDFIDNALQVARVGVAMLVRGAFLESENRYERLWSKRPPSYVLQFSDRVMMLEGRLVRRGGEDPQTGRKVTSATSYCWLVWLLPSLHHSDTRLRWLPPCMAQLERPGDYPDYSTAAELAPAPLFGAGA
jgi:hypothetical protein